MVRIILKIFDAINQKNHKTKSIDIKNKKTLNTMKKISIK